MTLLGTKGLITLIVHIGFSYIYYKLDKVPIDIDNRLVLKGPPYLCTQRKITWLEPTIITKEGRDFHMKRKEMFVILL